MDQSVGSDLVPTLRQCSADKHARWRHRLREYQRNGMVLRANPHIPDVGTYRMRLGAEWAAVNIWSEEDNGVFFAAINGKQCDWKQVWPRCSITPVSSAAYLFYRTNGKWPDSVPELEAAENNWLDLVGKNSVMAQGHEWLSDYVNFVETEAIAWYESIGSEIKTQDHADTAANYAGKFQDLERAAQKGRDNAVRPILKQAAEARVPWQGIYQRASKNKKSIKEEWLLPFLKNVPIDSATRPRAGSGAEKRVSIKTRKLVEFSDVRAFLIWAMETDMKVTIALEAAAKTLAATALKAGEDPPGVRYKEVKEAV
jgi:hypothetical protein